MNYKYDEIIFNAIKENPGWDALQLSNDLGISHNSVKAAVNRLIETGIVFRFKRRLSIVEGSKYKPPAPTIKEVAVSVKTPGALLKKENLDAWGDIVAIGQSAYKIVEQGRDLNHSKLPYSKDTYEGLIHKIQALSVQVREEDLLWFYRMFLLTQLANENFAFFSTLPTAQYPVEDVTESILSTLKD